MTYYLKDGTEKVRSFHNVTSQIPKWPALLNISINALERNGTQQDNKLTKLLGPDKVKLPAKNCQDGDYILQPEVKFCVDKCKVKHSSWEWAKVSSILNIIPNNEILKLPIIYWK